MNQLIPKEAYLSIWNTAAEFSRMGNCNIDDGETAVKNAQQILKNRPDSGLTLQDISTLANYLRTPFLKEVAPIIFGATKQLRNKLFGSQVALMAPVELSSFCASNCTFCGWRTDNTDFPRSRQTEVSFEREILSLISKNISHIELAAGDDLRFLKNNLGGFVSQIKEISKRNNGRAPRVSICTTPLQEEHYIELADQGLDCVLTWQETYDVQRYYDSVTKGPKRFGVDKNWVAQRSGDGYLFRLSSQERAIRAGLQVGLGTMLEDSTTLPIEITAALAHARLLIENYPQMLPIIFGMPLIRRTTNQLLDETEDLEYWETAFPYISCLYLLGMPDMFSWPFPNCRVPLNTQIRAVELAGNFSSTEVRLVPGGYTQNKHIEGDPKALSKCKPGLFQGEQFEHFHYDHDKYLNAFRQLNISIVDENCFLPKSKGQYKCG